MSLTGAAARARAALAASRGWRAGLFAFAAGALGVLAHAPIHFQPALIASLVLLVWLLDDAKQAARPVRAGFFRAWAYASGMFLAGTFWVANAFLVSDGHVWLLWMPLIAMPAGLGLIWGAAGAAYARLAPRHPGRIALFAGLFMAAELFRSHALSGFPWNLPGHVFPAGEPVSQIASAIGASGLSLVVLYAFAAPAALNGGGGRWARAAPLAASILLLSGIWAWGSARLADAQVQATGEVHRVVQLSTPQREKTQDNRLAILDAYLRMTAEPGLEAVDAVIWPEGAIPTLLLEDEAVLEWIADVMPSGAPLVTGLTRREAGPIGDRYFNSLAVLEFSRGQARTLALYDKVKLVPFGEGNPVRPITEMFGLTSLASLVPYYTPGEESQSLQVEPLPAIAPLICYEVIFPRFVPRGQNRPKLLVNISNDAWYGNSSGPRQHLNQARYRTVEEGLPMIRAAAAGVSGQIDPYGRGQVLLDLKASQAVDIEVLAALEETFYARYGDWPWLLGGVLALLIGFLIFHLPGLRGSVFMRGSRTPL